MIQSIEKYDCKIIITDNDLYVNRNRTLNWRTPVTLLVFAIASYITINNHPEISRLYYSISVIAITIFLFFGILSLLSLKIPTQMFHVNNVGIETKNKFIKWSDIESIKKFEIGSEIGMVLIQVKNDAKPGGVGLPETIDVDNFATMIMQARENILNGKTMTGEDFYKMLDIK